MSADIDSRTSRYSAKSDYKEEREASVTYNMINMCQDHYVQPVPLALYLVKEYKI